MMFSLMFPGFDPTLVQIGPIAIRWYALAYITSLVLGWRIVRRLHQLPPVICTPEQTDDFLTWATLGVVLGGRLGYVLFYQPVHYLSHPLEALAVWQGGMSFHGGALGVILALFLYTRRHGLSFRGFADRVAVVVPLGLGLGRIANFINGELPGRIAPDWLPWGVIGFPNVGPEPRHPSQLYQAGLEGVITLAIMAYLCSRPAIRARLGTLSGSFLVCYGIARIIGEFFRQPDPFLGFLFAGATMGQLLSLPMLVAGVLLIVTAKPVPLAAPAVRLA